MKAIKASIFLIFCTAIFAFITKLFFLENTLTTNIVTENKPQTKKDLITKLREYNQEEVSPSVIINLKEVKSSGDTEPIKNQVFIYKENEDEFTILNNETSTIPLSLLEEDNQSMYTKKADLDNPGLTIQRSKNYIKIFLSEIAKNKLHGYKNIEGTMAFNAAIPTKISNSSNWPLEKYENPDNFGKKIDSYSIKGNKVHFSMNTSDDTDAFIVYYENTSANNQAREMANKLEEIKKEYTKGGTTNCEQFRKSYINNKKIIDIINLACKESEKICKKFHKEIKEFTIEQIVKNISTSPQDLSKIKYRKLEKINEYISKKWLNKNGESCKKDASANKYLLK